MANETGFFVQNCGTYVARKPPSMGSSTPLIMLDLSLRRNTTAFTTSDTSPNLKTKINN